MDNLMDTDMDVDVDMNVNEDNYNENVTSDDISNTLDKWSSVRIYKSGAKTVNVPWLNRFELQVVVQDIYSPELVRQRRGYRKLLLWKARFPRLPVGIECTTGLLRVHLINQDVNHQLEKGENTLYAEHDLQLMFASALIRSINQLSFVALPEHDSIKKIEQKLKIPRWIINLRHEASHRTNLPSLTKLHLGIQFLLEWLHGNYWKETNTLPGWFVSKSEQSLDNKKLEKLLDAWQTLKMYEITGHEQLSQCNISSSVKKIINKKVGSKDKSVSNAVCKITKALLSEVEEHYYTSRSSALEKLLSLLLGCETFLPREEILNIAVSYKEGGDQQGLIKGEEKHFAILNWMKVCWAFVLQSLQNKYSVFPILIHKLLLLFSNESSFYRQLLLALWIKILCISMLKSAVFAQEFSFKKLHKMQMELRQTLTTETEKMVQWERIFTKKHPSLQGGFLCFPQDPEANHCSLPIVKFAVMNPNEHTSIFLPYLLMVAKPVISGTAKKQLEELMSLYLEQDLSEEDLNQNEINHHIHTVNELTEKDSKHSEIDELSLSFWGRASAYEWSKCPLGLLPWQKGSLSTLDFPSEVTWVSEVGNHYDPSEFNHFNLRKDLDANETCLTEGVNWRQCSKQRKKKKLSKFKKK